MSRRKTLITIGTVMVGGVGVYAIYKNNRSKNLMERLDKFLKTLPSATSFDETGTEKLFDPNYWITVAKSRGIDGAVYSKWRNKENPKILDKAFGSWYQGGDDEEAIYGVFRGLKNRVSVSVLAWDYNKQIGGDLYDKLQNQLDDRELQKISNIINSKPLL